MLLLEYANKIIEDTLFERFSVEDNQYESLEAVIADFDAVTFHLSTNPDAKNVIYVSVSIKCFAELK
jgi:hypothetical protein